MQVVASSVSSGRRHRKRRTSLRERPMRRRRPPEDIRGCTRRGRDRSRRREAGKFRYAAAGGVSTPTTAPRRRSSPPTIERSAVTISFAICSASTPARRRQGSLGGVSQRIEAESDQRLALPELPATTSSPPTSNSRSGAADARSIHQLRLDRLAADLDRCVLERIDGSRQRGSGLRPLRQRREGRVHVRAERDVPCRFGLARNKVGPIG